MLVDIIPKLAQIEGEESQHKYSKRASLADPEHCIRQLDYMAQGYEREKLPGRTYPVFDVGNWIEEIIADKLRRSKYKLRSEQMAFIVDGISCHIAGLITDPLGVDRLWEQKMLNTHSAQRYWKGELPLGYLTQMSIYIKGLAEHGIKEGILLIMDKNNSQLIEYLIRYDSSTDVCTVLDCNKSTGESRTLNLELPDIVGTAVSRFAEVDEYAAQCKLHERPYWLGQDWQCEPIYCGWSRTCWSKYAEEYKKKDINAVLENEVLGAAKYYLELGVQLNAQSKERDKVKDQIYATLDKINAQTGYVGGYLINLRLQEIKTIDRELLTQEEIARATQVSMLRRLYIKDLNKSNQTL